MTSPDRDLLRRVVAEAERAATAAGATVRTMSGREEEDSVVALLDRVWGRNPHNPLLPRELLRVLSKTGSYVAGAFVRGQLVGASLGLHSSPERQTLHSHVTGVIPDRVGASVGYALKLHQRAWCLRRGISAIEWTYDPLVSRNANFNIRKLGATPIEYLQDFYGPMVDAINAGDSSDRLLVRWGLEAPGAALLASEDGPSEASGDLVVGVPDDIEAMRASDPEEARRWRGRVREGLIGPMRSGARIVGFERGTGYILRYPNGRGSNNT